MDASVWGRKKALLILSDDWGMCAWCPTAEVYEELHPLEHMRTPWSSGTLETPADMERLFSLLEEFRGGDELPALFEPIYVVGSPNYAAIEESQFADYVDIGLDSGVAPGWERGDLARKAREGITRGVWHPGYHGRAHHFSPQHWIERLRKGDERAHFAFRRRVYVCEQVRERLGEYAAMDDARVSDWLDEGVARFERAFGYPARSARNSDWTEPALRVLAEHGVRGLSCEGVSPEDDRFVVYPARNINFEPFLTADHEDSVAETMRAIEQRWAAGQPAVVSSHRRNYKSFNLAEVERNYDCLEELLTEVTYHYPGTVFLCGDEVAQLSRVGWSVVRRGRRMICRNYGPRATHATVEIDGESLGLDLPRGETVIHLEVEAEAA